MKIIILIVLIARAGIQIGCTQESRKMLYTKSCDTVTVDTMICIKCTNRERTMNCKRYVCDFQNHCIALTDSPKDRLRNIKIAPVTTKKK